jgi:hypothetical protein
MHACIISAGTESKYNKLLVRIRIPQQPIENRMPTNLAINLYNSSRVDYLPLTCDQALFYK